MRKNSPFLIILGILLVAGGVVLYEREKRDYMITPTTSIPDQQVRDNQLKNYFPRELKTDPKTGEKIFEGLGVRIKFPTRGFKITTASPAQEIYIQTEEDYEYEHSTKAKVNSDSLFAKEGWGPPYISISFEKNAKKITFPERLEQGGLLHIVEATYVTISTVNGMRYSGTSVSGETEEVIFPTQDNLYFVKIVTHLNDGFAESHQGYINLFDYILSHIEFTR